MKWLCFIEKKENFSALFEILKRFCVLSAFSTEYQILDLLGQGHFAEVYSIINKSTNQKLAAKIFNKETEKFSKNSVNIFFHLKMFIIIRVLSRKKSRS